ncbi:MAG: hypothetical protein AAGH81_17075 [Bacteroidota bacterium]
MKTENNSAQEVPKNLFSSGMFMALDMMSQITLESLSSKKYEDLETIDNNSKTKKVVNPKA